MAGSSSNWFKVSAGPMKGQRVFISNAAIAGQFGTPPDGIKAIKAKMREQSATAKGGHADALAGMLVYMSNSSAQPAGQAKKKPAPTPAAEPKKFAIQMQAEQYAHPIYDAWGQGLDAEKKAAFRNYQGTDYEDLNKALRQKTGLNSYQELIRDNMVSAIADAPELPDTVIAYRGQYPRSDFAKAFVASLEEGQTYQDDGFMSLSLNKKVADGFSKPYKYDGVGVLYEFHVPKGTRAAYVQSVPGTDDDLIEEQELLFRPGAKYRVRTKDKLDDGRTRFVLDII